MFNSDKNNAIVLLKERMEKRGFPTDENIAVQFDIYRQELKAWNEKINLTSIVDDLEIIDKHFIDSLLIFHYYNLADKISVADIGTGGGFPGIPIKIYRPDIRLSLVESISKKAKFLKHIIGKLSLQDVDVINERAEVLGQIPEHRECYDLVVSRCVGRLNIIAEYCLPLLSSGGVFVAYKGHEAEVEIKEANSAIDKLGGRFIKIERDDSTPDRRALVFIEKIKRTPKQYPRRPGMARKKPL